VTGAVAATRRRPAPRGIVAAIAAALVVVLGAVHAGHAQTPDKTSPDKASLALAIAAVEASSGELPAMLEEMKVFADHKKIEIRNFPKQGQQAVNFTIPLGPKSFFYVSNSTTKGRFEIAAYSEEKPGQWTADWDRLIRQLSARLGKDHVTVKRAAPAQ